MSDEAKGNPLIGDLSGAGQLINSKVAQWGYKDGLSPAVKQVGALSEDTLKAFRLFTAPLQLLAAYQDRFEGFCDRVRKRVPEEQQREAPPEIARPVMEAFASTSDGGPLMAMFEELMTKAIDKREADKLSPEFPNIIKSLSPLQALLISRLTQQEQVTDILHDPKKNAVQHIGSNFSFDDFGGEAHHLTLVQDLHDKKLVAMLSNQPVPNGLYPSLKLPEGVKLRRTLIRLTMYGQWFASACAPRQSRG